MLVVKYTLLEAIMDSFNVKKITNELINWLREWFLENGKDCNAVIGISGGKDSTVVAALCVKAIGKNRVIGVMMPNGKQNDISDSVRVCDILDIKRITVNIKNIVDIEEKILLEGVKELNKEELSNQTLINVPARIRMVTLYNVAAMVGNARVANTCNYSEDYVGYSTKYGDAAGDFAPLQNLLFHEVKEVGYELGLPKDLIEKAPEDGLSGKTDEDNFGFTYATLDHYIETGEGPKDIIEKIERMHKANLHKLLPIPKFEKQK